MVKVIEGNLKPECSKCFGLCCTALYFSKSDGFPTDKNAGTPCPNLQADFLCKVHEKLDTLGLKGCVAYECFGAGQQVSQVTFAGRNWRMDPLSADLMFQVFLIVRQLHEMCWYLAEALSYKPASPICEEIGQALIETKGITNLIPDALIEFDLSSYRSKINVLLTKTSSLVQSEICRANKVKINAENKSRPSKDFFGKDLRNKDLRCKDMKGACLIAANLEGTDLCGTDFTGADLRDTNLKGADLSKSIFLTQYQVNSARGDNDTKLPSFISRPKHWF